MGIKILFLDVDGTLTDGGIYLGNNGNEYKKFNIKDGYAIARILPKFGIIPIVITGRDSKIVEKRCRELGVEHLFQGCDHKADLMKQIIKERGVSLKDVAFIGDDLNDYECMKMCGLRGCPADACHEVVEISDFVSTKNGGQGAVREFIEWIVNDYENSSVSTN